MSLSVMIAEGITANAERNICRGHIHAAHVTVLPRRISTIIVNSVKDTCHCQYQEDDMSLSLSLLSRAHEYRCKAGLSPYIKASLCIPNIYQPYLSTIREYLQFLLQVVYNA